MSYTEPGELPKILISDTTVRAKTRVSKFRRTHAEPWRGSIAYSWYSDVCLCLGVQALRLDWFVLGQVRQADRPDSLLNRAEREGSFSQGQKCDPLYGIDYWSIIMQSQNVHTQIPNNQPITVTSVYKPTQGREVRGDKTSQPRAAVNQSSASPFWRGATRNACTSITQTLVTLPSLQSHSLQPASPPANNS
jgi:hypothetical protein